MERRGAEQHLGFIRRVALKVAVHGCPRLSARARGSSMRREMIEADHAP